VTAYYKDMRMHFSKYLEIQAAATEQKGKINTNAALDKVLNAKLFETMFAGAK
jgi:hypothetical protein